MPEPTAVTRRQSAAGLAGLAAGDPPAAANHGLLVYSYGTWAPPVSTAF